MASVISFRRCFSRFNMKRTPLRQWRSVTTTHLTDAEEPIQSNRDHIERLKQKQGFIIDMDGVLYHANHVLKGAPDFIRWLQAENKRFLFLTNASDVGQNELSAKILRLTGIKIPPSQFYTSALATAAFLHSQTPNGSAYVVGTSGLINALYNVGFSMNDINPDYVVVGETRHYDFHMIERAAHHVRNGAKLVGTNRDIMDRVGTGFVPSTGALVAPIELMTNRKAYFVGKPNPLIMNRAMLTLGTSPADTVIIGDRMDTDIIAGLEAGIDTILVMSGVTTTEDLTSWPYKPSIVLDGVYSLFHSIAEAHDSPPLHHQKPIPLHP
eukprot:TRINITY_DN6428_c0_g1_i1.p1 TRINITY_DN6428_c0_g1~~TRINITY_DN6428_c0_g1_i1.p1  ORF type:complete len:325 (-),score=14.94 TRINITY_DN6428_c0_g1_i1:29-1003(-)